MVPFLKPPQKAADCPLYRQLAFFVPRPGRFARASLHRLAGVKRFQFVHERSSVTQDKDMRLTVPLGFFVSFLTLPLCAFAATAIAKPVSDDSATISGTILDNAGQPANDATVFVYSAHLKNGYAIVCPTCWIDCGKRADTDTQGQFTITGLNPNLRFRLLVLKDGFTATAKGGVDPAQRPLQPIKLTPRTASLDDSKIVHGRITDVAGNAVSGALIDPVGAVQPNGITSFGSMEWLDPLAATNKNGEFSIVSTKPIDKVMLRISPRGLAPKLVTAQPGPTINSIILTEGATIMGRLVDPNGKPAANSEILMISHAESNGEGFGDMRVGTDKDGAFVFTNVPSRRVWGIYPSMESLQARNLAGGVHWCETTSDRGVVDIGKLTLRHGLTLTGKIGLADNNAIPPGMHATIKTEWAVNNRLADVAPDGTFEFKALAPGIYNVSVAINGYAPTPDSPKELLIEHDRRNVVIHMARSP
jgi:hypothetical protein